MEVSLDGLLTEVDSEMLSLMVSKGDNDSVKLVDALALEVEDGLEVAVDVSLPDREPDSVVLRVSDSVCEEDSVLLAD